jgi:hypothetical protein
MRAAAHPLTLPPADIYNTHRAAFETGVGLIEPMVRPRRRLAL